jgi:hypothetical protein
MRFTLFLLFVFLASNAFAQNYYDSTATKKPVFVRLKDGTTLRGRVVSTADNKIRLRTDNLGEVTLDMSQVAELSEANGYYRKGQFWGTIPFSNSYFGSASAFTPRRGEGTYQNTYVFINTVNFGVTDFFSLGGGVVLIPGGDFNNILLTPKVSFRASDKVHLSVGTLGGLFFYRESIYSGTSFQTRRRTELGGVLYGNVTFGTPERNGTIGLGWGYGGGEIGRQPVITASYLARAGRKVAFITDNLLFTADGESVGLVSAGVRLFGERIGGDLALYTPFGTGVGRAFLLPFASLKVKFGRAKGD